MKYIAKFLLICLCLGWVASLTNCGKEGFTIGRGTPDHEIQKCMRLSEKKRFEEAIECLEIFKSRYPQTVHSREAELAIADNYFNNKEYLLAAETYHTFIKLHPGSPRSDYAYYRVGLSYLKESPKAIDRDQQYLDEAIYYLRIAVGSFPDSPYHEAAVHDLKDARNRVARRNYYIGNFYYRSGEYKSAVPRFIDVVNIYPDTDVAPKALYKLVIAAGKLKKLDQAKLFYSKLSVDYPDSEWTKKAEPKLESIIKKYGDVQIETPPSISPDTEVTP